MNRRSLSSVLFRQPFRPFVHAAIVGILVFLSAIATAQAPLTAEKAEQTDEMPFLATAWLRIDNLTPYLVYPPEEAVGREMFRRTQAQLILSPLVLRRAAQSRELAPELAAKEIDDGVGWLRDRLFVRLLGRSELLTVTVVDVDAEFACKAASAVVSAYFNIQAHREAESIQKTIETLAEEQERLSNRISQLRENLDGIDPQDETSERDRALLLAQYDRAEELHNRIDERQYRLRLERRAPARITLLKDASRLDPLDETIDAEDELLADIADDAPSSADEAVLIRFLPVTPTNTLRALIDHSKVPWYAAEAWIQFEAMNPFVVFPETNARSFEEFAATQLALIRSPLVLERVIADASIAKRLAELEVESPGNWLHRRIVVERLGESLFHRVAVFATDPQLAADLTNATLQEYLALQAHDETYRNPRVLKLVEVRAVFYRITNCWRNWPNSTKMRISIPRFSCSEGSWPAKRKPIAC